MEQRDVAAGQQRQVQLGGGGGLGGVLGNLVMGSVTTKVMAHCGTPVLVIDSPRGELLVPFAEDICTRVDVGARRIEIAPPEGLLDLNER